MRAGWVTLNIILGVLAGSFTSPAGAAGPVSAGEGGRIVNAVFQSERGAMALIGGVAYRPGERVRGAEILTIERGAVRLRTGDGEYMAWVGSELPEGFTALPEAPAAEPVRVAAASDSRGAEHSPGSTPVAEPGIHTVAYGDTLSTIADRYRPTGMPLDIAISAILEANTDTIGDIDRIYAGSSLRIPDFRAPAGPAGMLVDSGPAVEPAPELRESVPSMQAEAVKNERAARDRPGEYVPVMAGDTLSGIAQTLKMPGISSEQLMQALYDANPDAFGGSMDLLFAGEVLQVPVQMRTPSNGVGGDEVLAHLDRQAGAP